MRIRTKLALSETILAAGFLLSLGIFLLLSNTITKQKDFQIKAAEVLSSLERVETETQNLLRKRGSLAELRAGWLVSISSFQEELAALALQGENSGLTLNQEKQLYEVQGLWNQIHAWYYVPALKHLRSIIDSDVGALVSENGLLFTLQTLLAETEEGGRRAAGELLTLQNYTDRISEETVKFVEEFKVLSVSMQKQINANIQNARGLGLSFALLTLAITIFVTVRFSRLLVGRIHQVEEAMRQMASGDFSSELDIQSGDEFEELSHNYNILKEQLQDKLNSVLNFMVTIATSLEEGPDLNRILSIIASSAVENTDACGAAIYLIDGEEESLIPHTFSGYYPPPFPLPPEICTSEEEALAYVRESRIPIGTHSIGTAVKEAKPLFIRSTATLEEEEYDFGRHRQDPLCVESLIISPLMISQRVLGAIVIAKRPFAGSFTDLDFTHMQTFADYAALTIDNLYNTEELIEKREMHREIAIAADIQKGLLPRVMPGLASAQIAAFSRAARGISGDYYDAFLMEKGKIGVVICDVVGKGVPASLLMVMIRTIIRLVANPQRTPGKLLTFLNRGIIGRIGTEHFATLSIFSYNENDRTVTYANAAHPPLLLYKPKEESFLEIDTPGLPIGVERKEVYQEKSFSVDPGDILVLFTDGIPEARSSDGREYTANGLRSRLRQCGQKSAKEIAQAIQDDLDNFAVGVEQHDDQTLMIMKILD